MDSINQSKPYKVAIWDAPTRVFHWLFALSFTIGMITEGDSRYLDVHVYAGYLFFGLLIFRLVWGFIGSYYSRFSSFRYSWGNVVVYLKGLFQDKKESYIGHNPAGSWAIFFLLFIGFLISITGLLVFSGEEGHGPLVGIVPFEVGVLSHGVHEVLAWSMLVLVSLHIFGVIVESSLHKENLLIAMINGYKKTSRIAQQVKFRTSLGISIFVVAVGFTYYSFQGYVGATDIDPYMPYKGPNLVQSNDWNEACSDCHMPYHPSLLPAESWATMFEQQQNHFDEDLDYSQEYSQLLEEFAIQNSADKQQTEAAKFISSTTPEDFSSLRITDTPYWKAEHESIPVSIWETREVNGFSECDACHRDALMGTFEDAAMHFPKLRSKEDSINMAGL